MRIVCSWCRQEGITSLVGEKAPLDDARETHGICVFHRHDVQARWYASAHSTLSPGVTTGLYSALFRLTGLLGMTRKMRP